MAGHTARLGTDAVTRPRLFLWLFLLLSLNAVAGPVLRAVRLEGLAPAILGTFGISAIVWLALAAAFAILWQAGRGNPVSGADRAAAAAACCAALVPAANLSSAALAALALYAIGTSRAGTPERRAGFILLAVTASLLWGRLLLGLFSRHLLFVDAFFVTNVVGAAQVGNVIAFNGAPGGVVVAPGCSSLQGMSLALVFWATVTHWFGVAVRPAWIACCAAALLAALAINVIRLAALVNFPERFDAIHAGWGWHAAAWATLAAVAAVTLWGARREISAAR